MLESVARERDPPRTQAFGRHAPRAARVHCAPGPTVVPPRSGRMVGEAVRKPTSEPLSVSSYLRALRVNRPEAGQ